jgi:hypothetical protein
MCNMAWADSIWMERVQAMLKRDTWDDNYIFSVCYWNG